MQKDKGGEHEMLKAHKVSNWEKGWFEIPPPSMLPGPSLHVVDINIVPTSSVTRVKCLPKKVAL